MKHEERFDLAYIGKDGTEKHCYPRSREKRDENLRFCEEHGVKVLSCKKLYPFSTMRNQHNFMLIYNICFNTMTDMQDGEIEFDEAEYERLEATRDKAGEFFCMELPIAWVPWETLCEMREMAAAAEWHRDAANARAREERDARDSDWRPGDAPWNAPGMSARDFI